MMRQLDFVLMRGGTSKGVFLRASDVPDDREDLAKLLLAVMGSPDRRQIDGLGGADKLTSKAAIMGPPTRADSDVSYLFGQVGITVPQVEFNVNCGNLTAAAAVYAIEEGLVAPREGTTRVRIHNVNTDKIITADVPVANSKPLVAGDLAIDGVPGTGAPIALNFGDAAGAITGQLLPLGAPQSLLSVPELGEIPVSVVDCANLVIFVTAETLGMRGAEAPDEVDGNAALIGRINAIRRAVAHRLGFGEYFDSRPAAATPFCVIVSPPAEYTSFSTGRPVPADSMDIVCRQFAAGSVSRAYAATVTACTGVAARLKGSVLHTVLASSAHDRPKLRIGHPSGTIAVESSISGSADNPKVDKALILRTARRLAEGRTFLLDGTSEP
ncbi:hypothetical protein ASD80_06820 [Devosia sp. Root635]|nr:hypothetical protein ASD80_06820 [Devosia sp. Root635]